MRWFFRGTLVGAWLVATSLPALAIPHAGDVATGFSLPAARGGTVVVRTFAGKPTYLNFFASWCPPCEAEAPSIGRLYRAYHRRGLSAVGIDEQESAPHALEFTRRYDWPFPVALDDGSARAAYGAFDLPVHVFIDRNGKVSTYRLGAMSPTEIEQAIRKII